MEDWRRKRLKDHFDVEVTLGENEQDRDINENVGRS